MVRTVALLVLFLAACAHVPPAPAGALEAGGLKHLYCVDPPLCTIYRSRQPTAAQFTVLVAKYGLKSVIKLNSSIEGRDHLPGGVVLFDHPWLGAGPVTHEQVEATLDDLEAAPKPTLIHCTHGVDRTGLLVALWRVRHGVSAAAAYAEWLLYGRNTLFFPLTETFTRETHYDPDGR